MANQIISLDIGNSLIKVIVGNSKNISHCGTFNTPANCISDGSIVNVELLAEELKAYFVKNNIIVKNVAFTIHGQDIVIRHTETPIMEYKALIDAVKYELGQYLPDNGQGYFFDYEVIERINIENKPKYKLLVAAVPKVKINDYYQLAKSLNLKVQTIDLNNNCVVRVFKEIATKTPNTTTVGIIDIGINSSSIVLMENGKLNIEKEVPFGINNILREFTMKLQYEYNEAKKYFYNNFDFSMDTTQNESFTRIRSLFDNVFSSFERVIQFYMTGKTTKNINKLYIIGAGTYIKNIDSYLGNYFNTEAKIITSIKDILPSKTFKNDENFNLYINAYGLLLNDSKKKHLNIIPEDLKADLNKTKLNNLYIIGSSAVVAVLVIVYIATNLVYMNKNNKLDALNAQIKSGQTILSTNVKLKTQVDSTKVHITEVNNLTKNKVGIYDKISSIQKYVPNSVVFQSMDYKDNKINISATSSNYNSINEFIANLQSSDIYKNATVSYIKGDSKSGGYNFSITIDGVGALSNAKAK